MKKQTLKPSATHFVFHSGSPVIAVTGRMQDLLLRYPQASHIKRVNMRSLPLRSCSIRCIEHPEWGTWGVMEDYGGSYAIRGNSGSRVLDKAEAATMWEAVVS